MHGCEYHKTRNKTRLRKAHICQHTHTHTYKAYKIFYRCTRYSALRDSGS